MVIPAPAGGVWTFTFKDHYITLTTSGLDLAANGNLQASHLSNLAADGSFNVTGEADFADGFYRVIFWHVNADGTSTAQMMKNKVLPENSQSPGEQHSAGSSGVNSTGTIGGNVQSYLGGKRRVLVPAKHDA